MLLGSFKLENSAQIRKSINVTESDPNCTTRIYCIFPSTDRFLSSVGRDISAHVVDAVFAKMLPLEFLNTSTEYRSGANLAANRLGELGSLATMQQYSVSIIADLTNYPSGIARRSPILSRRPSFILFSCVL